jgi:hypothetical protein
MVQMTALRVVKQRQTVASKFDLEKRIEALQAAGLAVESEYRGTPPQWLTSALFKLDLRVINCKGIGADDTIVMVRLGKLEQLIATATEPIEKVKARE